MTFQLLEDGIDCETVNNEMYFIAFDIIQKISSYTYDQISYNELRLEIETSDYEVYTFSEKEDSWIGLTDWVREWANLPEDWKEIAFPEAFSNELTVLWQSSPDH